ncbi:MAG: ATP-dependent DNA helicase PcrA [Clostridia bacterium]|nr:ATP-dependent DNA helicase PcrA [Clostridia bacterium]
MEKINLAQLNPSQQSALEKIDGAVMVLAGAGSGKTRLITYRIAHLIKNLSVSPENILAITFTNKASNEMKNRLFSLVGDEAEDIWISTFHSMCVRILRRHISSLKSSNGTNSNFDSNFSIYTDTEKEKSIKNVLKSLNIEKDNFAGKVGYHISRAKNANLSPWDYQKENLDIPEIEDITKVYSAYQSFLGSNNALDFDDLLTKTYKLFIEFPEILKRYQNKFMYIHIDEFQDTNHIQYEISRLLAKEYKNIFVVGDEDQCIYSWRGASIKNILDFKKDFANFQMFRLEQNYRSTKQILTLANKLIKNNQLRNEKTLWTENDIGLKGQFYNAQNEFDEAEFVAIQIKNLVKDHGFSLSDFAVLSRLNAMSAPFEEKFLNYNIPYRVFGGNKFFDRVEIKILTSYLKMLTNPYDSTSFSRIINFPKRGIGEATISSILELSEFHNTTPYNLILNSDEYMLDATLERKIKPFKDVVKKLDDDYQNLSGYKFIESLVKTIDFKSIYSTDSEEDMSRLLNIDNFLNMAQEYFKNDPKSTVSEFLQSITLVTDMDSYDDTSNTVTLATIHSVKGLEFRCVFIVGLEERLFPIVRMNSSSNDLEEERRLMFVAITRAKERLYITNSKSRFVYGKRDYLLPSRFLVECGIVEEKKKDFFAQPAESTSSSFRAVNSNFSSFSKKSFAINKNENISNSSGNILSKKYAVGLKVSHPKFGIGIISSNQGIAVTKCVSINFADFGTKTLSVEYAPITLFEEKN